MKMPGKGKKIVSVAYKEKLLAEIAHYDKRIKEALTKQKRSSFENESSDDERNPYTIKNEQSWFELKQQEASLSDRASMTLELSLLTIIQSEVNVMVTPPELRKPVPEEGIWLEVAAECKIDLVTFNITFYAHKPHRRFGPTRFRNLVVGLAKPAHQKELAQSVLPKLNRPQLALQVLQSYATAFRSRRTTLLELAETYDDKLKMEAMPEGGYRVKFLNILQIEWTLANMWSPIVPFCHRMKFEVEYMPKDYIHTIGKLYKQFKDPSLETSERTQVLSEIFDTCLEARGLAREIQESFESDPESASRLHERRTTIDQEPDVPNVEHSPEKPKGKENKAQNRKTNMAPPKTIPKKAKKVDAKKANERKSVKRAIDDVVSNDAKKSKVDDNNIDNNKSKAGLKGGKNGVDDNNSEIKAVTSKTNVTNKEATAVNEEIASLKNYKKNTAKVVKNAKAVDKLGNVPAENDGKSVKSSSDKSGGSGDAKISNKKRDAGKIVDGNKDTEGSDGSSTKRSKKDNKNNDNRNEKESDAVTSNKVTKNVANTENNAKKAANSNGKSDEGSFVNSNKGTNVANTENNAKKAANSNGKSDDGSIVTSNKGTNVANTENNAKKAANGKSDEGSIASSKHGTKESEDGSLKDKNTVDDCAIPKNITAKGGDVQNPAISENPKDKTERSVNVKKVNDANVKVASKIVATNNDNGKTKTVSNNLQSEDGPAKTTKSVGKQVNVGKTREVKQAIDETAKKATSKDGTVTKNAVKNAVNKNLKVAKQKEITKNAENKEVAKKVERNKPSDLKTINKNTENKLPVDKKKTLNTKIVQKPQEKKVTVDKTKVSAQIDKNDKITKTTTKSDSVNTKNLPKIDKDVTKITKQSDTRILKENTNRDTTQNVKKNDDQNKVTKNNQNILNVTITKSKTITPLKTQTQKLADKLKTKIPIIKNKITFSSLRDKVLGNNIGKISQVEKNKMAPKLPAFKKVVKNLPTRISPRKLPSTFKSSSKGFFNKYNM